MRLKHGPGAGRRCHRGGQRAVTGRQGECRAGELGRNRVPQARAAQHRMVAVAHLDGGHLGYRAGPFEEGPGIRGAGDAVGGAVGAQHPPACELADRLAWRQPGRQAGDRRHRGVGSGSYRGARAHGVPDQHDRDGSALSDDRVERLVQVADRGGQRAVPAADAEAGALDHAAAPPQRQPDRGRNGDHPEHGGLQRGGRRGARRLAAVRDVAVAAGRIAAVGTGLTAGAAWGDVDVAGQVVTAGFIDLHSHVSDLGGLRLRAMDGVTTALELEAGVTPAAQAYQRAADEGRPINYGFAASWALARMEAVAGLPPDASLGAFMARISDPAWQRPAEPAQVDALLARLAEDIAEGALGIGVLLGYAPAASPAEYLRVAGLAAEAGVPTFTHARDLVEMVPATLADGAEEIVRAAAETGAHMHYCHVNSTSQRHIDRVLALVARAQAAGSRVTTEAYPYGSGMTGIGAAFLAPERLGERGLSPSSLTYAPTAERVASADRLRELRAADPGGLVIIDLLREDEPADRALLMRSLTFPGAVVASDAMPLTWTAPPADPRAWPLPPTAITHPRTRSE